MYAKHRPRREHLYVGIKDTQDLYVHVFFLSSTYSRLSKMRKKHTGISFGSSYCFQISWNDSFFFRRKSLRVNHDQTIANHGRLKGAPKAPSSDHLFNFIRGFREMAKNPGF